MQRIAADRDASIPQIAIRYLLQKTGITSVVIGARSEAQLNDNLGATNWKLSQDEMQTFDQISKPPAVYPYWFINSARQDRKKF